MVKYLQNMMKASLASGTIYFAGDVTAQTLIEGESNIDFDRTARFALIGACWAGPFCRLGMGTISALSGKWYYRVALDQSLLMPFNMAMVNWLKPLSDGKDAEDAMKIWREKYPSVITLAWLYWLPTAVFLYGCVKKDQIRFIAFNIAAYVWQVNLARIMNQSSNQKSEISQKTHNFATKQKTTKRSRVVRRISLTPLLIWFDHTSAPWHKIFFSLYFQRSFTI